MDSLISVDEAVRRLQSSAPLPERTEAALSDAFRRVIVQDMTARFDIPQFTRSMLDGFAVRTADVVGASREKPVALPVAFSVAAGDPPPGPCPLGAAVRTMTGGPVAEGADAVVRLEHARESSAADGGRQVFIYRPAEPGEAIQLRGGDTKAGSLLIPSGTRLSPAELGVLASHGYDRVPVSGIPRVGILATGSEVLSLDRPLVPGMLYNSNTPMLAAIVRWVGCEPVAYPPVSDRPEELEDRLGEALRECDVVVTTGGVSIGDYDFTPSAFEKLGVERLFWGVWMRPGTPVYAGVRGKRLVMALSGNPAAAFVNAHALLIPALERRLGLSGSGQRYLRARMARPPQKKAVRHTRFLRGQLLYRGDELWIDLGRDQSSGVLGSFVGISALARVEPEDALSEGEAVRVLLV